MGHDNARPPKRPALDLLANLGGSVDEGPGSSGGGGGGGLTRSSPHHRPGGTTPGRYPRAPLILLALQRHHPPPPPPPPAAALPASLPDVFRRISAALCGRAVPRQMSPPWGRRQPQPKATTSVGDMLRARPPRAAAHAARGGSSDPVADAPSAPWQPQSTLPQRQKHGRAVTAPGRRAGTVGGL